MVIALFTDRILTKKIFSGIVKKRSCSLEIHGTGDIVKQLKKYTRGVFAYYDISGVDKNETAKALSKFGKICRIPYGIIDPGNQVADVAELFFNGASDYLGGDAAKKEMPPLRFKKVIGYARSAFPDIDKPPDSSDDLQSHYTLSGTTWDGIKSGNEYTFCFMFIELDYQQELKKLFGSNQIDNLTKTFHDYMEKTIAPIHGRIWIWQDFGGIILFPFDGVSCAAVLTAFRLMLNRHLISVEDINFDVLLSYRIVLYLGNTVYESRGDTGNIVSDSINSIYHIGQKFAEPGIFLLTKKIFELAPKGLGKCFLPAGEYDGKKMMKMRPPK